MKTPLKPVVKHKSVKPILKTLFKEKEAGKPGMSISELSDKTGIERHKLSGMLEILTILGILVIFQMGMVKMVSVNPQTVKTISEILMIQTGARL